MKVLLLNGSPRKSNSTMTALQQVARGLSDNEVEHELAWLTANPIKPCVGCKKCDKTQRCIYGEGDGINALIEAIQAVDGLVIGSPVHYAGMNGSLKTALDRIFYAAGSTFAFKPAGALVCARRGGTTSALDQILKYPLYAQMPVVSSFYWTMVHGQNPEEIMQDEEGIQAIYQMGANMAWLLKAIEVGYKAGVAPLPLQDRAWTNFIR